MYRQTQGASPPSSTSPCHHDAACVRPGWRSQEHQQCGEERQTPGAYQTTLQSHCQASNRDDEAWLRWQIWNHPWSLRCKSCWQPHRQASQVWSDQPQIWCATERSRKMAEWPAPVPWVWFHRTNNLSGHHGPWRSTMKTQEGKLWILFQGI